MDREKVQLALLLIAILTSLIVAFRFIGYYDIAKQIAQLLVTLISLLIGYIFGKTPTPQNKENNTFTRNKNSYGKWIALYIACTSALSGFLPLVSLSTILAIVTCVKKI